jgi:hypothetical protein
MLFMKLCQQRSIKQKSVVEHQNDLLFEIFKPSTELIHSFYFAYGGQNPTVLIEIYFSEIETMNTISSLWQR